MRTEADLRDAIDEIAREGEGIVALREPRRARQHRRAHALAPLAAALAVAAIAVAGVAVLGTHRHDSSPSPAGTRPQPLMWSFSVRHVPGWTITRDDITRFSSPAADVDEIAGVASKGTGRAGGTITFDSVPGKILTAGKATTVDGIRYYFQAGHHVARAAGLTKAQYKRPWVAATQDTHAPQLAWNYPDGTQFVISGSFGFRPKSYNYNNAVTRRIMMRLARAVITGQHDRVTRPFRLPALHHGLAPVSIDTTHQGFHPLDGRIPLSACLGYAKPRHPSPMTNDSTLFQVCRVKPAGSRAHTLSIIGFGPDIIARRYVRTLPDGTLLAVGVPKGSSEPFSQHHLRSIADRTNVSPNLSDAATWLKVR